MSEWESEWVGYQCIGRVIQTDLIRKGENIARISEPSDEGDT